MNPDDVDKETNEVKHLKTGDTSNALPYVIVMLVSLGLLGFAADRRKKVLKK